MTIVDIETDKLDKARVILGTESVQGTIDAAFRQVIRLSAVRYLVTLGQEGAFSFLLEPEGLPTFDSDAPSWLGALLLPGEPEDADRQAAPSSSPVQATGTGTLARGLSAMAGV